MKTPGTKIGVLQTQDSEVSKTSLFASSLKVPHSYVQKTLPPMAHLKKALPDATIRLSLTPPSPAAREKGVGGMRASRRRRYSGKALPVVTICNDAVNKAASGALAVTRTLRFSSRGHSTPGDDLGASYGTLVTSVEATVVSLSAGDFVS